ncbi:MAG: DUF4962 domain-containing protein, partial [Pirellulaceae bacterium]|nr:DUF4962 domain-containing protein [Pirellulaceae bacterium]
IAFHGEIPEAETWLDYVMTILYTAYPVWGDADGGWHEGVSYWSSYNGRFMYWVFIMRSAFGINVFERPFYRHVGDFALYTLPPGSQAGAFGDLVSRTQSKNVAPLMAILASGAQNPYWKWYADTCGASLPGGYLGFLYAANSTDLAPKAPSDLPSSKVFRGVGVAALNTNLLDAKDNVQVHFKSSPMGRQSHGYNANNAFVLNKGGQRVFTRSGERDVHGSPHHKEWMWESKSDNAILVNGKGQIKHSPAATGFISAFESSPTVDVVVGEAAGSYENLERWTRRIVFFKPNVILIHDILEAPEPSTFQWTLHAIGTFALGEQEVQWEGEPGSARVRFLEPAGLNLSQTDQYSTPPHEWAKFNFGEWHLTAAAEEPVTHREFLTLITLDGADAQEKTAKSDDGANQVSLTLPSGTATVELRPDGFKVAAPGFDASF